MKKLIVIFLCTACTLAGAAAQPPVRIGSLEFSIKKVARDSVAQIAVDEDCPPCPPCPSENKIHPQPKSKPHKKYYSSSDFFAGFGFVLPDNRDSYYTTLGGNSFSIDVGYIHRYQLARRFALLGSLQYSYYNYRLRNAASDSLFRSEIIGKVVDNSDIKKQVFRSHNFAVGGFTRFHLVAPRNRSGDGGIFVDLGVQGDYVFSKYYNLYYTDSEKKKSKNRNGYAFSPFTASAVARVGWGSFAVFARYRFTDAFNPKALPTDLPPITIGMHFL